MNLNVLAVVNVMKFALKQIKFGKLTRLHIYWI